MGLVYLPTFTIKINHSCSNYISVSWMLRCSSDGFGLSGMGERPDRISPSQETFSTFHVALFMKPQHLNQPRHSTSQWPFPLLCLGSWSKLMGHLGRRSWKPNNMRSISIKVFLDSVHFNVWLGKKRYFTSKIGWSVNLLSLEANECTIMGCHRFFSTLLMWAMRYVWWFCGVHGFLLGLFSCSLSCSNLLVEDWSISRVLTDALQHHMDGSAQAVVSR